MTAQRRAWMQALTNPQRESLSKPFRVELDGRQWDAATTGQAMLFMATESPAYEGEGPGPNAIAKVTGAPKSHAANLDIDSIRDWSFTPDEEEDCEECDGYCDECGEACGGSQHPPRVNHGRIRGILVNRALLYRFIPPGAHGPVAIYTGGETDPIMFDGGDWRLYLMGMRDDGIEAPELVEVTQ